MECVKSVLPEGAKTILGVTTDRRTPAEWFRENEAATEPQVEGE